MSNATKPMGQHILDELGTLEAMVEEMHRRFASDAGAVAERLAQLRVDVQKAREERQRRTAAAGAAEQAASGVPAPRSNGARALQGRQTAEQAAEQQPLQRGGQQHRPDTDPAPGDEPPVAWPCRHPDGDGYALKLQDRAVGGRGMTVRIETKAGKTGKAELEEHIMSDKFGEVWSSNEIRWDD